MTTIDLDTIVDHLRDSHGIAAYVEQTGGGCATIYCHPMLPSTDARQGDDLWPVIAAGPGWFDRPWHEDGARGQADTDDFHWGAGDPALCDEAVSFTGVIDEEAIARQLALAWYERMLGVEQDRIKADAAVLDRINLLLSATSWPGHSGMEDIAEIVRRVRTEVPNAPEWRGH